MERKGRGRGRKKRRRTVFVWLELAAGQLVVWRAAKLQQQHMRVPVLRDQQHCVYSPPHALGFVSAGGTYSASGVA